MRWQIIKKFSGRKMFGFTLQDVLREFPEKNYVYLVRILSDMVSKGMLLKIARNIYHIIPIEADSESYKPERFQVAKYIMSHQDYYIGYASALKIHGIKPHTEDREYVVTRRQMKPAIRSFGEYTYQFIQHDESRFFGFSSMWITPHEEAMVSDLERTIVDMATQPQYCGGIIELGKATFRSKDLIDQDKLFYYFSRNNNMAAKKRFLFLTEILHLEWTRNHTRMKEELGPAYSLLDPNAPDQGKRRKRFGLKVNVDPIRIREQSQNRESGNSSTGRT